MRLDDSSLWFSIPMQLPFMKKPSTILGASTCLIPVLMLFGLLSLSRVMAVQVIKETGSYGRDYYLFLPDKIDPGRTYWLVVEVGGFQGATVGTRANEKSGVSRWVSRGNCIGISPSFPNGYQVLLENTDVQLINIFHTIQDRYQLHKKLFLYGHSGGAQFAHRFTLKHPDLVAGCCATSGGSWADELPSSASDIPIAVSCGENDTALSTSSSPMNRIDWAKKFSKQLDDRHFFYKSSYWPNVGHEGNSQGNHYLTDEAFSLGTSGMVGKEYEDFSQKQQSFNQALAAHDAVQAKSAFAELITFLNNAPAANQTQQNLTDNGWKAGPKAIVDSMQIRRNFVAEETKWMAATLTNNFPPFTTAMSPVPTATPIPMPAAPTPQPKPFDVAITQAALLELYGPNGNLTAVSPAVLGEHYQCCRIESDKAVLRDANGKIFKIKASAITPK
jgi:pimeloyl-ACP methyl ester carboxylesterase